MANGNETSSAIHRETIPNWLNLRTPHITERISNDAIDALRDISRYKAIEASLKVRKEEVISARWQGVTIEVRTGVVLTLGLIALIAMSGTNPGDSLASKNENGAAAINTACFLILAALLYKIVDIAKTSFNPINLYEKSSAYIHPPGTIVDITDSNNPITLSRDTTSRRIMQQTPTPSSSTPPSDDMLLVKFRHLYLMDYTGGGNKKPMSNPLSEMKRRLDSEPGIRFKDIVEHGRQNPDSRTARVLRGMNVNIGSAAHTTNSYRK